MSPADPTRAPRRSGAAVDANVLLYAYDPRAPDDAVLTYLTANDGADFLRAARALSLHFPPMQRVEDVSERIEDLSDIPHAASPAKVGGQARCSLAESSTLDR